MLNYEGKICVVTGAASGMGKATAELLVKLNAEVYAMDIKEIDIPGIKKEIRVDLSDKESIDNAVEQLPEKIDCFFSVAGLRGATLPFMTVAKINLIANKYLFEEKLIDRFNENGAIAIVSSAAGANWQLDGNMKFFKGIVDIPGWDASCAALEATGLTRANGGLAYVYTKLAVNYLIEKLTGLYGPKHVRVNGLLPGDTLTAFGSEDGKGVDANNLSPYCGHAGRAATAEEMAKPLIFLNSDMASYVSGSFIFADYGASGEIMAGLRNNPVGESLEATFSRGRQ